jgi:hypothetical protein
MSEPRLLLGLVPCVLAVACGGVDRAGHVVGQIETLDGRTGVICSVHVGRVAAKEYRSPCIDHTSDMAQGKVEVGHSFLCSTLLNTTEDSQVLVECEGYSSQLSEPFHLPSSGRNQVDLGVILVKPPVL